MANSGKRVKQLLALPEVFNETRKLFILYHLDFFGPGRRSICLPGPVWLFDLSLDVFRFGVCCPRDNSGVGEACLEQVGEDEDEENGANDRDDRRDALCEERTVKGEEEARGADDQEKGDVEDSCL